MRLARQSWSLTLALAGVLLAAPGARAESRYDNLLDQLRTVVTACSGEDLAACLRLTDPRWIAFEGGPDAFEVKLKRSIQRLRAKGVTLYDVEPLVVLETRIVDDELQALVRYRYTVEEAGRPGAAFGHLLAFSRDQGLTWTYCGSSLVDRATLAKAIPTLHPDLFIPRTERDPLRR